MPIRRADSVGMKRFLSAAALVAVVTMVLAPSASAEPSPLPSAEATPVEVATPTEPSYPTYLPVPPTPYPTASVERTQSEQFAFLGYKVTERALRAKTVPTSARSEIKRFQSKFGLKQTGKSDRATLRALNRYAGDATVPSRCLTGRWTLCVNKFNRTLQAIDADGAIAKVTDVRFGMSGLETREGTFRIQRKGGYGYMSTLYKVNMPYPMFFSGGQAVHFSWEFYRYPSTKSHGCVGTRDIKTQKWLWDRSPVGTPVIVFDKAPA